MNENLTSKLGNIKHILQNIEFLMFFGNELRRTHPAKMNKYSGQTHFIHTNESGKHKETSIFFDMLYKLVSLHQKVNDMVWVIILFDLPLLLLDLISSNTKFTASVRFSLASSIVSP